MKGTEIRIESIGYVILHINVLDSKFETTFRESAVF